MLVLFPNVNVGAVAVFFLVVSSSLFVLAGVSTVPKLSFGASEDDVVVFLLGLAPKEKGTEEEDAVSLVVDDDVTLLFPKENVAAALVSLLSSSS